MSVVREGTVIGGDLVISGVAYEEGERVRVELPEETTEAAKWVAEFRAWAAGLRERHPDTPVLDDAAMSRDSIYGDR